MRGSELECSTLLLEHVPSFAQSLVQPVSSLTVQFLGPKGWQDLSLPSAHTPVLLEVFPLNYTFQYIVASLHRIPSEPPSVECCNIR